MLISGALHSLNICGDNPVEGEVYLCDEFSSNAYCTGNSPETTDVSGQVDNISIGGSNQGYAISNGRGEVELSNAKIYFYSSDDDGTAEGAIKGFFILNASTPETRAIYCFDEGSEYQSPDVEDSFLGNVKTFRFRSFSKIDSCPSTSSCDLVEGCLSVDAK